MILTAIDCFNLCLKLNVKKMIWWGANYYCNVLPISSCWIIWDKNTGTNDFPDCEIAWCNESSPARIFRHTWNGMIKDSERGQKRLHPTQKPIELAKWCIENYSDYNDSILDLFIGSGSSLIAAQMLKRNCFGIDIDPAYTDITIDRYIKYMTKNNLSLTLKKNNEVIEWEMAHQDQTLQE